jgi:hypothetical protein
MFAATTLAIWQGGMHSWGFIDWACFIVLAAAVVAIVITALNYFGVQVPPVFVRVFWIVVVAAVCIAAILFLAHLVAG